MWQLTTHLHGVMAPCVRRPYSGRRGIACQSKDVPVRATAPPVLYAHAVCISDKDTVSEAAVAVGQLYQRRHTS